MEFPHHGERSESGTGDLGTPRGLLVAAYARSGLPVGKPLRFDRTGLAGRARSRRRATSCLSRAVLILLIPQLFYLGGQLVGLADLAL